jgi:hypothetical protein
MMVEQSPMAEMAPQMHRVIGETINNHHHHNHNHQEEEEGEHKERGGGGGDGQPTSLHLMTKINDAHGANVADEHEYHNHQPIDDLNDGRRSTLMEQIVVNDVHMGLQKRATAAGNADDDDGMPMPTAQEEEAMAASTTVQQEQENL